MDTLKEIVQERHDGQPLPHQILRDLVRERRAEKLLVAELRKTIKKWRKGPSKLPRDAVAKAWFRLLKM